MLNERVSVDELTKEAQKRSRLKKLREKVDFSGKAVEHFSDEFRQIMESLREVDDSVREIAMGEKGSDPGQTLKDLLRVAETNFKRREYMTAISFLGRFHDRVETINAELAKLTNVVDTVHHKFLFEDIDPDQIEYLTRNLAPKFHKHTGTPPFAPSWLKEEKPSKKPSKKASDEQNVIVVEAGIKDWWHNLTSDRGKTLSGWEKRFPKYTREIKAQTSSMLARSQSLLDNLITTLKQLDSYRATRKLEEYIQTAQRWRERYKAYNTAFISFYNGQIRRFIDYQDVLRKKKEEADGATLEQIEQADTEGHQGNTPKSWPPSSGKGKSAPGGTAAPAASVIPTKDLVPLLKDEPLPEWEQLPPSFQKLYTQTQLAYNKNKAKPYADLPEKDRRLFYNALVLELVKHQKKKDVAFPPPNPTPPQVPTIPTPMEVSGPTETGEHPVIPFVPTERVPHTIPTVKVPTPHPITPTPRSPGVEVPSAASFPLVNEKSPLTEVEPMRPQFPLPPKLPADLIDLSGGRRAHTEFLTALEAKASEHPMVQAVFILDYAKTIEADEPEQCKSLRALASSILGK
jgi:hypothetical protein